MKSKILVSAIVVLACVIPSFSQDKIKFGTVSKEEIETMTYEADAEASAVVLFEEKYTDYDFTGQGLFVNNSYVVRIKILTNDGLDYANVDIPRYVARTHTDSEVLSGLTGYTHNVENGKVERSKLEKEHIFKEKTSEYTERTKFALPKVRPGSVIEYKYSLRSPHYGDLDDFVFQRGIPVQYSKYTLRIPEYFRFNKEVRGGGHIQYKESKENGTALMGGNSFSFTNDQYIFEVEDLPALRAEKYVWCPNDFMTKVTFELRGIEIPGVLHKSFTGSWENVDKQLKESDSFGKQFGHKLFKEELTGLLTAGMTEMDKIRAIYNMVRSKVKLDDNRTLWAKSPKNALKKGVGTSAEINALLLSALKEAGFEPYPVAMSLRGRGRVTITHPTIDKLNYFVACVEVDGKPIYLDASSRYGDLNVLPTDCLVDYARNIGGSTPSQWLDLTHINQGIEQNMIEVSFNEDNFLSGKYQHVYSNQSAYSFRQQYGQKKSEQDFIDEIQNASNIQVADFKVENIDDTDKRVMSSYSFVKTDAKLQDEFFYFNPLIFPEITSSPFKAENRALPVEFAFPYKRQIFVNITLPADYVVEELPKMSKVALKEGDITFMYQIMYGEETHHLTVRMEFVLNKILYSIGDYELLRDFYMHVATQNATLVTLKKKAV